MYHHTQQIGALPGALIVAGLAALVVGSIVVPPLVIALIAMAWAAWTFSMQTTAVTADGVEWAFRSGFWRKRIPFSEIAEARTVQNSWWFGWGIHLTPYGWLYNVGGMLAVQLDLKSGRSLRIGTDEPEAFAAAIAARLD